MEAGVPGKIKRAILQQPWGGLGDNLQFTTLPGLYHQRGIEFYLSSQNTYRNNEIYDMVWRDNPYVKGIVDEPGNVGWPAFNVAGKGYTLRTHNIITAWESEHLGIDKEPRFKAPIIFYRPKIISSLYDKTIVDLGGVALGNGFFDFEKVKAFITDNFDMTKVFGLLKKGNPKMHNCFGEEFPENVIEYETCDEYMNIISSCCNFVGIYSGSNAIAAALNKHKLFNAYCLVQYTGLPGDLTWHTLEDPGYLFDTVVYKNLLIESEMKI